jgi:hypothetical protein
MIGFTSGLQEKKQYVTDVLGISHRVQLVYKKCQLKQLMPIFFSSRTTISPAPAIYENFDTYSIPATPTGNCLVL